MKILFKINQIVIRRLSCSFAGSKRGDFFQPKPEITNQFLEDAFMQEQLKLEIPEPYLTEIQSDLSQFGERCATDIHQLGLEIEHNPPKLVNYDAWGNRIDQLIVCEQWKEMKRISAREGLIAIPYEKKFSVYSRLYQILKLYLFAPSSGLFSCPLAMTDGAAKTIQTIGLNEVNQEAYENLISRDPAKFFTSGQWMTERRGGSDVANGTDTIAVKEPSDGSQYKLYGYKWFSSATDADMTITLARCVNPETNKPDKGLTMFLANVRNRDGTLNGIEIHKLKDKLGTRQLPTAELLLDGMTAYKMSDEGRGISGMANMLNITRIHNSLASVSNMRRIINLARDYATKRKAFGKYLVEYDLHNATLANMEVECRASFLTLVFTAKLLGKSECNEASEDEMELLRFLTPLLKLYTAKQSIAVCSEGLEAFGGQGYIEDTGLPNLLRDSQVLSIWEGTTNILSLDALRSIEKSNGKSLQLFMEYILKSCEKASEKYQLKRISDKIELELKKVGKFAKANPELLKNGAREFSFTLYRLFTASLILERCILTECNSKDIHLLNKWCSQDLSPVITNSERGFLNKESLESNFDLVLDGHPRNKKFQIR